jgi:hypothetical protein
MTVNFGRNVTYWPQLLGGFSHSGKTLLSTLWFTVGLSQEIVSAFGFHYNLYFLPCQKDGLVTRLVQELSTRESRQLFSWKVSDDTDSVPRNTFFNLHLS